jgi:hypothetical protein
MSGVTKNNYKSIASRVIGKGSQSRQHTTMPWRVEKRLVETHFALVKYLIL